MSNRERHRKMMSCMTLIYSTLSKSDTKDADVCARALVLLSIVHEWARQNKFIDTGIELFSTDWYHTSSWALSGLQIEHLEEACNVIAKNGLNDVLRSEFEGVVNGKKIENLSDALSSYDTTLDLDLEEMVRESNSFSAERRDTGSHYTPWDVSQFMVKKINKHHELKMLDPAVGTGTFLLAFIDTFQKHSDQQYAILNQLFGGDKDQQAVWATRLALWAVGGLESEHEKVLVKSIICDDFLVEKGEKNWKEWGINAIIMNPPYVVHRVGDVNYKSFDCKGCGNLWTLFVEKCFNIIDDTENTQMVSIVPASLATSVRCKAVRRKIIDNCEKLHMMNIDVVPGYLFKQGKTEEGISTSTKTRSISPRVTIFWTQGQGPLQKVWNTIFLRWHNDEREELLKVKPKRVPRKPFTEDIFPMGGSKEIKRFLELKKHKMTLKDLVSKDGDYPLYIVKTARYYISGNRTDLGRPSMIELRFAEAKTRDAVHAIMVSNLFFWYWRAVGNGFQITNQQVLDFPFIEGLQDDLIGLSKISRELMDRSEEVIVMKTNATKVLENLRFDGMNEEIVKIDKILIDKYRLSNTNPQGLAKYKSPLLDNPIPVEYMERNRGAVFDIAKEFIENAGENVDIEALYKQIKTTDDETGFLGNSQKEIHKQRTGPKEFHWRHDLRNSLHNAKSNGELINPRRGIWGFPKPLIGKYNQNKKRYLMWNKVLSSAENHLSENKKILDRNRKEFAEIISVSNTEIRISEIGKERQYVITPGLLWNKLVHLNNCNGKQGAETFHSWKALRVSMVALHPRVDWIFTGKDERVKLLHSN